MIMRWLRLLPLVLRSSRCERLEEPAPSLPRGRSRIRAGACSTVLRDASPWAPLLRTRSWGQKIASMGATLALLASLAGPALAVQPDEVMKDPALETRARALSGELRCLVCQNESIDDSEAPLARDIRVLIRERIGKGESNDAVRAYLVSRYGDFILLKPPFKPETLLLWLSPVLTLGLGVAAALYARRRAPSTTPRLSAEEEARLAALTNGDASNG
jgi:cytochrome c-type biogenesis protein CcmH